MRPLIEILEDERAMMQRLESIYRYMLRDDDPEVFDILHAVFHPALQYQRHIHYNTNKNNKRLRQNVNFDTVSFLHYKSNKQYETNGLSI